MAYIDVITLASAKTYLRVDTDLTDDDALITTMLEASLSYIERCTNIFVYARDVVHLMVDGRVTVYDYPINSIIDPATDVSEDNLANRTNYLYGNITTELTLNVGYVTPSDVPKELLLVAYEILDIYYYGKETGKTVNDLSAYSKDVLNNYRRFTI